MSKYCFLCLSDEGVFLDVTPNNYKTLCGEIETYLPIKIEGKTKYASKVCYKCAYELKQCCDFVKRYKESRTNAIPKSRKQCCNLCSEPAKKGYIFKLDEETDSLNNPLTKIKELFNENANLTEISKSTLVCLTCRYSLDVLFDLLCLSQEIAKLKNRFNNDIDYTAIPKINTTVIKRKTTNTSFMRIKTYVINDSDSDSSTRDYQSNAEMNKNLQPKLRMCDQCHKSVEHGGDMYRFHRTGLTVCKHCWTGIDLNKRSNNRKTNKQNTKQCAVFLKDVFSDATLKQQKPHRVEKDNSGNQVYIITESESEVEVEDKINVSETPEAVEEKVKTRSKRRAKDDISDDATKHKRKVQAVKQNAYDLPQSSRISLRSSTRGMSAKSNHYSDTDIVLHNKLSQNNKTKAVKRRNTSVSSVSDIDTGSKRTKVRLTTIVENISLLKDDTSSNDTSLSVDSKQEYNTRGKKKRKGTRSRSMSTNDSESLVEVSTLKSNKLLKTDAEKSNLSKKETLPHKTDENETNVDEKKEYACSICAITCESKLIAATHELTHFKQLELILHRISNQDKLDNEKQDNESSTKQLIDELAEQQNEEITLTVNDDEEIETTDMIEDTAEKSDKEACTSITNYQEKDLLKTDTINKESIEESKVTELTESVHEKLTKTGEDEIKISDTTSQNELTSTSGKNENTQLEDTINNQIQNDSFTSDVVKDKQKELHDEIVDKDKTIENENVESAESAESEIIQVSTTVDKDEKEENENVESTKPAIEDNITNEIEKDEIKELEKDKEEKVEETEENKTERKKDQIEEIEKDNADGKADDKREEKDEKTEKKEDPKLSSCKTEEDQTIKIDAKEKDEKDEKEQNSNIDVTDDQKDLNANNAELKDTINIDEVTNDSLSQEAQSGNLSQEAQSGKLSQEAQNGNSSQEPQRDNLSEGNQGLTEHKDDDNDKAETNTEINITLEKSTETSISKCDKISEKDNINSSEEENKEVNVSSTKKEEKENNCKDNSVTLLKHVENVNSSEPSSTKKVSSSTEEINNELDKVSTEMVENIFDLTTDELESRQIFIDHNKRCNEMEAETLENISREIEKSADMPSLDPINSTEVDHNKEVV